MMDPDMDSKRRLGHFDTVVSPITPPITYHHRNLATDNENICAYLSRVKELSDKTSNVGENESSNDLVTVT